MLLLLRHAPPDDTSNGWHASPSGINEMLAKGGLPSLPKKFASKALMSNRGNQSFFEVDKFDNKRWHCFNMEHMWTKQKKCGKPIKNKQY